MIVVRPMLNNRTSRRVSTDMVLMFSNSCFKLSGLSNIGCITIFTRDFIYNIFIENFGSPSLCVL